MSYPTLSVLIGISTSLKARGLEAKLILLIKRLPAQQPRRSNSAFEDVTVRPRYMI